MKRNYSNNDAIQRCKRPNEYFHMDTFYATKSKLTKSLRQKTCCQLFVNNKGHVFMCPLREESNDILALKLFAKDVGVPKALVADGAKAETSAEE